MNQQAHNSALVNLSIPENVTRPIIEAKIQEAVLIAMGGADKIVEGVVFQICNTMLDPKTGRVDNYSSNNTMRWMDYHVTKILQDAIQAELSKQIVDVAAPVREALIKHMRTPTGAKAIAEAFLASISGTFGDKYTTKVEIKLEPVKKDRY